MEVWILPEASVTAPHNYVTAPDCHFAVPPLHQQEGTNKDEFSAAELAGANAWGNEKLIGG